MIIYYDGKCALCHAAVKIVLKLDNEQVFKFSPLSLLKTNQKKISARARARPGKDMRKTYHRRPAKDQSEASLRKAHKRVQAAFSAPCASALIDSAG